MSFWELLYFFYQKSKKHIVEFDRGQRGLRVLRSGEELKLFVCVCVWCVCLCAVFVKFSPSRKTWLKFFLLGEEGREVIL
jgi:hypothetical protein